MKNTYLLLTLLTALSMPAQSDIFTVDRFEDAPDGNPGDGVCHGENMAGNVCTLRAAIMEANASIGEDTIFLPTGGIFKLTHEGENDNLAFTGDLDIFGKVTVKNFGSGFVIDGNGSDRIFHVLDGAELILENGTLTNGFANVASTFQGGAIMVEENSGAMISQVEFINNTALHGGAIYNEGTVWIESSYLHHNAVADEPLLLQPEGSALFNRSIMIIDKTTVSQNGLLLNNSQNTSLSHNEFAIHISPIDEFSPQPLTTIVSSTIESNNYGGVFSHKSKTTINFSTVANHNHTGVKFTPSNDHPNETQLTMKGTIIANNASQDCNNLWTYPITEVDVAHKFNASTDQTCGLVGLNAMQDIEDPFNGSLSQWGGLTPTLMLKASSPVIDFVNSASCPDQDQRDGARPLDGSNGGFLLCDVGALEFDRTTDPLISDIIFKSDFEL